MAAATVAVAIGVAIACSSGARYPACERDEQCAVSGKHDYCLGGKCVYCRTTADCGDRQRCRAGKCEVDPDAPPPRLVDAGEDASEADAEPEAGDVDDDAPPESPRHVLPRGVRRYLHP